MAEIEQQYMETSENGHEAEDDQNGAGGAVEGLDDSAFDNGDDPGADGGTDGGQIDASKDEEDAG